MNKQIANATCKTLRSGSRLNVGHQSFKLAINDEISPTHVAAKQKHLTGGRCAEMYTFSVFNNGKIHITPNISKFMVNKVEQCTTLVNIWINLSKFD